VLSQHIGDLDTVATWNTFQAVIGDLERMYSFEAVAVACDQHPDYRSTGYALSTGKDVISIQHHHAHILSCMADNHLSGEVLGIAWDGTGYGDDGTIWGGECLKVDDYGFSRFASLLPFRLPGGDKAVREPRRIAAGLLFECFGTDCLPHKTLPTIVSFTTSELSNIGTMLERGINSPLTTSMGRLFDGVAAILGVRDKVRHEGQAAMELEFLARASVDQDCYALPLSAQSGSIVADWRPMVVRMIDDHASGAEAADLARRFHNSLGNLAVDVALLAGIKRVVMSGGCFQNRLLTELCILRLRNAGFTPYWHQRVPPNDGGISLGQLFGAAQILRGK
jgi:hydrogenase maturation protein HypF